MNGYHTLQDRRTVLERMGTAGFVSGISGVAFSGTVSADIGLSEITSDPRTQAIESEIGSLSYGSVTNSTHDVNDYVDTSDDVDIKHAEVNTDNGTLEYAKGYVNGTLDQRESMLFNFDHSSYVKGDIGTKLNTLIGFADGTTHFRRSATNAEVDDAMAVLGYDNVIGHTDENVSELRYPAWNEGDSDYSLYDGDDVNGGGGGGDPPKTEGTGEFTTTSGCDPSPADLWMAIGTSAWSIGITIMAAYYPGSGSCAPKRG